MRATAAAALVAALVLAACSGGGGGAASTTGVTSSSVTTTTASKPPLRVVDGAQAVLVARAADGPTLQAVAGAARRRLAVFGEGDVLVTVVGNQIAIDLPVADTAAAAIAVVTAPGVMSIHTVLSVAPSCAAPAADTTLAPVPFRDRADGCAVLGPALNTGPPVQGAGVGGPVDLPRVELNLTLFGIDALQRGSAACFAKTADCPAGRLALVLDGVVLSAPVPQAPTFTSTAVEVAGTFSALEVATLVGTVAAGPLPTPLAVADGLVEVHRVVVGATPAAAPTVVVLAQLGTQDGGPSRQLGAVADALRDELRQLGIDGASLSANDDNGTLTVVATGSLLVPEALKEAVRAALDLKQPFRLLVFPGNVA
ncbi:MAG: hypothetical protein QOK06_917 [Acidimicrobiaceae bacterium]